MLQVKSEITGVVVSVEVRPGDTVAAGTELVILESMKMEMPVLAPASGTVAMLKLAAGDLVNSGDVIAVIEP